MLGSMIRRPIPAHVEKHPDLVNETAWFDTLGLDSEYDYDPVWAKCVELGLSPTFHSGGRGYGLRISPTNFTYNHIGHFGVAGEAVCKALFLGGVTRRFPRLCVCQRRAVLGSGKPNLLQGYRCRERSGGGVGQ